VDLKKKKGQSTYGTVESPEAEELLLFKGCEATK